MDTRDGNTLPVKQDVGMIMGKKQRNTRPSQKGPRKAKAVNAAPTAEDTRRSFMRKARNWAIGVGIVGAAGWVGAGQYSAMAAEHDLSRIGRGVATVVQIHDPQCPTCARLMKQARAAMAEFSEQELQYVVANIRTDSGAALAAAHGVGKITLLLFDGAGRMRQALPGVRDSTALQAAFRAHLQQAGRS
ncbi:MAG: hypothetical protein ACPGVA_15675 [Pikeienuella sp.]